MHVIFGHRVWQSSSTLRHPHCAGGFTTACTKSVFLLVFVFRFSLVFVTRYVYSFRVLMLGLCRRPRQAFADFRQEDRPDFLIRGAPQSGLAHQMRKRPALNESPLHSMFGGRHNAFGIHSLV